MSSSVPNAQQSVDIQSINRELQYQSPTQIIEWVLKNTKKPIITTNFRPQTAAILHLVTQVMPNIPVLWVDTGYNVDPTLEFANQLTELLNLNLSIYSPESTAELENFKNNGIPAIDTLEHSQFSQIVKINPFQKALAETAPDSWITGIRQDQTNFRQSLDILSYSNQGILKVAPLFYWSKQDQLDYIRKHGLPDEHRYFDPTKASENRECGIQLL